MTGLFKFLISSIALGGLTACGSLDLPSKEKAKTTDAIEKNIGRPAESKVGVRLDIKNIRGELAGMPEFERTAPQNQKVGGPERWAEVQGGRLNYGLGTIPAVDPLPEKTRLWKSLHGSALESAKDATRERLFKAVIQQSGGCDPRKLNISWANVTFTGVHKRVLRSGVTYEHEFQFPSGILGMWVTGRFFVPESALNRFARGEKSPAVIYEHFHGGLQGVGSNEIDNNWWYEGLGDPLDMLTELGVIAITTDVHGFNRRRLPTGRIAHGDSDADTQDELDDTARLYKHGMSRYAVRSYEDFLVYRLVRNHPMVMANKVSAMGMSMGGVRTWTLAALAGTGLRAGVANGTFPRFREAALTGKIRNHRNTQNLVDAISRYNIDTEDFIFAATSTNMILQFGDQDKSSPGHEVLFQLATAIASPGMIVKAEIQPRADHAFTLGQIIQAYSFFAERLQGRDVMADLVLRATGHK